jgi:hypothetical protein
MAIPALAAFEGLDARFPQHEHLALDSFIQWRLKRFHSISK